MPQLGSFSNSGLGFGLAFTLKDFFTDTSRKIKKEMGGLEGSSTKLANTVNREFRRLKTGLVALGIGLVITSMFKAPINKAMEFNSVMSSVQAKSRATDAEFQVLKASALELGTRTKFTALEAAQGMDFLAMAGFRANQVVAAMPGLLDLAAAGNADLSRTADIASNIMTALGMKAQDMGRIADVMSATIVTANVNIEQMGQALKFAAPRAGQLGVSIEKLSALTGMLGDVGIQGTIAGTAMREFFTNLSRVTEKGKLGVFKKLGLGLDDIVDRNGDLKDINKVMGLMLKQFRGMGNIESAAIATKLFGVGGDSVVASLLSKSAKDFDQYVADLENSTGAASELAAKMLDNLKGDVTLFKSQLDTLQIKIGDTLEPILRPFVKVATKMLEGLSKFIETPVGKFLARLVFGLGALLTVLGAVKIGIALVTMATAIFGGTLWAALAPLLPVIAAVAALAAVGYILYQRFQPVIEAMGQIWNSWDRVNKTFELTPDLQAKLESAGLLDLALAIGTWVVRIKEFFLSMKEGFSEGMVIVKKVQKTVQPIFDKIDGFMTSINAKLFKNTSQLDTWKEAGKAAGYVIAAVVGAIILSFKVMVTVINLVVNAAIWLGATIVGAFMKALDWAVNFWEFLKALPSKMYNAGVNMIRSLWNGMKSLLSKMVEDIASTIKKIPGVGLVIDGVNAVGDFITGDGDEQQGRVTGTGGNNNFNIGQNQAHYRGASVAPQFIVQPVPIDGLNQNGAPIVIHTNVQLDGEQVGKSVNEWQNFNNSRE